jgi:hypothetical protein
MRFSDGPCFECASLAGSQWLLFSPVEMLPSLLAAQLCISSPCNVTILHQIPTVQWIPLNNISSGALAARKCYGIG